MVSKIFRGATLSGVVLLLILIGCVNTSSEENSNQDFILTEKDLIPEGVAVDKRTGIIYVGGTYKRKIIQISLDGKVEDFIPQEMDGMWSPVGMEVDETRNILWVNTGHANEVMPLINPDTTKDWMTAILAFDISERGANCKTYG